MKGKRNNDSCRTTNTPHYLRMWMYYCLIVATSITNMMLLPLQHLPLHHVHGFHLPPQSVTTLSLITAAHPSQRITKSISSSSSSPPPPSLSSVKSSPDTATTMVPFRATFKLHMGYSSNTGKYYDRTNNPRSKRQERVGQVVRTELANILHRGHIPYLNNNNNNDNDESNNNNGGGGILEDELRKRISIVNADVSPDLRRARITVSILGGKGTSSSKQSSSRSSSDMIEKRRAYAWLVRNTKSIRHALSSKMAHMKGGSPELTFVQVDVGAAVDVMNLIDKVITKGYKREDVGRDEDYWKSMMMEMEEQDEMDDFNDEDDEGWIDEDEDEDDDDYDDENDDSDDENDEMEEESDYMDDADNKAVIDNEEDEWEDFDDDEHEKE